VKALFPLWGVVLLLVVTRVEQLGLKELLKLREPAWSVSAGSFGEVEVSAALVLALQNIFGTAVDWTHETLYVPSILPFFAIAAVTWLLYRMPGRVAWELVTDAWRSLARPIVALMAALVFVKLLMVEQGGAAPIPAATTVIGESMAAVFGGAWPLVAPFLGELGAFFSGSATVSNLTFGPIQDAVASDLGLDRFAVLAQQAAGAGMGNMVCIHNIVAVCSVLGLLGDGRDGSSAQPGVEGFILRRTVVPAAVAGVILGLVGSLFQLG
jgi:lactate permease